MDLFSRRNFLGATAGAVGIAAASGVGQMAAGAEGQESAPRKKEGMRIGILTAPFGGSTLEEVAAFARSAGISCLEVAAGPNSRQLDPAALDAARIDAINQILADSGLEISSLAWYPDMADPGKAGETQSHFTKLVDAAAALDVKVVCTITGFPKDNASKIDTIKKVLPGVFAPLLSYAKDKGVKIAIENYFQTCLQGLDTFECLFETIQDEHFGLNYDPSHLYHQQCSHLAPVKMFAKRIFHTHAKDCLVDVELRGKRGVYAEGWWRYVIPGFGNIDWGEYIGCLRQNGYKGVLSIEHEDNTFGREEGFAAGAKYLGQFC